MAKVLEEFKEEMNDWYSWCCKEVPEPRSKTESEKEEELLENRDSMVFLSMVAILYIYLCINFMFKFNDMNLSLYRHPILFKPAVSYHAVYNLTTIDRQDHATGEKANIGSSSIATDIFTTYFNQDHLRQISKQACYGYSSLVADDFGDFAVPHTRGVDEKRGTITCEVYFPEKFFDHELKSIQTHYIPQMNKFLECVEQHIVSTDFDKHAASCLPFDVSKSYTVLPSFEEEGKLTDEEKTETQEE